MEYARVTKLDEVYIGEPYRRCLGRVGLVESLRAAQSERPVYRLIGVDPDHAADHTVEFFPEELSPATAEEFEIQQITDRLAK